METHGIKTIVPDETSIEEVHRIIFEELVRRVTSKPSRQTYQRIIECLIKSGAEGIILGCTEIPLLMREQDAPVPFFDTTTIHAMAAVEMAVM